MLSRLFITTLSLLVFANLLACDSKKDGSGAQETVKSAGAGSADDSPEGTDEVGEFAFSYGTPSESNSCQEFMSGSLGVAEAKKTLPGILKLSDTSDTRCPSEKRLPEGCPLTFKHEGVQVHLTGYYYTYGVEGYTAASAAESCKGMQEMYAKHAAKSGN